MRPFYFLKAENKSRNASSDFRHAVKALSFNFFILAQKKNHFLAAVMTIETPNGKSKFLSHNLSALKILPKMPFKAETLTLFSDSGLMPVTFIKVLPAKIGAKNVQLA